MILRKKALQKFRVFCYTEPPRFSGRSPSIFCWAGGYTTRWGKGNSTEQKTVNFMIIMGAMDIKQELRKLIEKENDLRVLEAIKTLLVKSSLDPVLKEKLTSRALKAEEDIKAGRVYTREELEKKLDNRLGL
ncbi:MAG: hypothetical protein WDZ72_01330 [Cyclobacteriaceae bacterium]